MSIIQNGIISFEISGMCEKQETVNPESGYTEYRAGKWSVKIPCQIIPIPGGSDRQAKSESSSESYIKYSFQILIEQYELAELSIDVIERVRISSKDFRMCLDTSVKFIEPLSAVGQVRIYV